MNKRPAKQHHLDDKERFIIANLSAMGRTPTNIAKEIGRDKTTVLNAVRNDQAVIAMITAQKEELAELFEATARQALHAITTEKLEKSNARDLGILAGVCTDKNRLLTGQSTSNSHILLQAIMDTEEEEIKPIESEDKR